jgi:RNA polymerase sigma-70 factor (ECF subfamily)
MTKRLALGETTLADNRPLAHFDDAFAAFVQRQSAFVFRVAYAALRNAHDAEDVAQEVFLKLYRTSSWRQMNDERAYLARSAWRSAIEKKSKSVPQDAPSENTIARGLNPEQQIVEANWSAVVHQLMDALPEELRMPLALSAIDELTSREIAATLRIPEGTVRTRLMKAREVLKEKLARLLTGGPLGK